MKTSIPFQLFSVGHEKMPKAPLIHPVLPTHSKSMFQKRYVLSDTHAFFFFLSLGGFKASGSGSCKIRYNSTGLNTEIPGIG